MDWLCLISVQKWCPQNRMLGLGVTQHTTAQVYICLPCRFRFPCLSYLSPFSSQLIHIGQILDWHFVLYNKDLWPYTGINHQYSTWQIIQGNYVWRPGYADVVICLPNIGPLTDDDEDPDNVFGIVKVQDEPGTLEIQYLSSEGYKNKEQADLLPSTTH